MKIAVFHNFMDNIGGAERVGLTLARELNADFYTTNIDETKIKSMGFGDIRLISVGKVPINAPLRQQLALKYFRNLNLGKKYDFYIIDGDWAMSGAVNHKPNLWYVHSPIREIWDLYQYTRQHTVGWSARWAFDIWVRYNRFLNLRYAQHVNHFVCNSTNTKNRVGRYLGKEATVVYPPIETKKFHFGQVGGYWLAVNRLIGHKRVDLQLDIFRHLPQEKLIIVGSYEQSDHFNAYVKLIQAHKPPNVEILSWVDQDQLVELYANCKGFITTAVDEDFGMTPVEAMASGKPVIALNEGGYRETVLDGVTGRLLKEMTVTAFVNAIKEIGQNPLQYKEACLKRAQEFDTAVFIDKIKKEIDLTLKSS